MYRALQTVSSERWPHGSRQASAPRRYGIRRADRVLRVRLGLDPDSAFLLRVAPQSFQSGMGKYWPATDRFIQQALSSGRLPAYTEERCANIRPLDTRTLVTNLSSKVLGTVGTAITTTGTASAAAGGAAAAGSSGSGAATGALAAAAPFLILGAVALGVIGAIFAHHAQAVAKEQSTMCAAVPGANDALAWIDAEFSAGRLSKQDATAALDELYSNFDRYVAPVRKDTGDGKKCNLACGYTRALQAIVAKKKQQIAEAPVSALAIFSGDGWAGVLPYAAAAALVYAVIS